MPPEIKIWLHRLPSKRNLKKRVKFGGEISSIDLERNPSLVRWVKRHCIYKMYLDAWEFHDDNLAID